MPNSRWHEASIYDFERCQLLKGVTVVVEQPAQHGFGDNFAFDPMIWWWNWVIKPDRNMLGNALMRSLLIEVVSVSRDDSV